MMGWNNMMGLTGGGVFVGGFIWLLILGAIVTLVVLLARNSGGSRGVGSEPAKPESRQTPTEILETRYARGEIDREDYETRRKDLEAGSVVTE